MEKNAINYSRSDNFMPKQDLEKIKFILGVSDALSEWELLELNGGMISAIKDAGTYDEFQIIWNGDSISDFVIESNHPTAFLRSEMETAIRNLYNNETSDIPQITADPTSLYGIMGKSMAKARRIIQLRKSRSLKTKIKNRSKRKRTKKQKSANRR